MARRERTNTPLQALLLMNETEFFQAAKSCAVTILSEADGDEQKGLSLVYEKVTSHKPDRKRMQLLQETLRDFRSLYKEENELAKSLTPELQDADQDKRIETAAWTMMTHSLFNLELTKVRR